MSPSPASPSIRFRLSGLLLATTALAVLAAIAGPLYRQARAEARGSLLALWAGEFGVVVVYLLIHWQGGIRRKYIAGTVRFKLRRTDLPRGYGSFSLLACGACFTLLFTYSAGVTVAASIALARSTSGPPLALALWTGASLGFVLIAAVHFFLYRPFVKRSPILICDHAVVIANRVLSWSSFARASWHYLHPARIMLSTWSRPYSAEVPEYLRNDIEAFVAARTKFEDAGD